MLDCTACGARLPLPEPGVEAMERPCPVCNAPLEVRIYPSLGRELAPGEAAAAVVVDGESSCFEHPDRRARSVCDRCGRFLCALCEIELDGRIVCPACFGQGAAGPLDPAPGLERQRMLYDRLALSLAIYPLIVPYFTMMTAPVVLYLCWRFRKSPCSLPRPRGKRARFITAGILATLQLVAWVSVFATIFYGIVGGAT